MRDIKWQLLNQRFEVISELNTELGDLIQSALQLVQALESERTSIRTTSSPHRSQEISWTNHQEELT